MLDGYVSEKEQIESIKKWWNENGKWIAIAIIAGLAIGFGWRYFHTLEKHRAENAAVVYASVLQAQTQNNFTTVQGGAKILMKNFSSSPYASLAAFLQAKNDITQNKLADALTSLQWVVKHSDQKRVTQIARLYAARILLAQNNTTAAMEMLKTVDDKNFQPLIDWVMGNIYAQEGNTQQARVYYADAKAGLTGFAPATNLLNQLLAQ